MKNFIEKNIIDRVQGAAPAIYREPLIGYARADDPIFSSLKEYAWVNHHLPTDLLPEAKTVMAFFLPFKEEVVKANRTGPTASRQWAEAYDYTNKLIGLICQELQQELISQGVPSGWLLPTYKFDKEILMAQWSHRHAAYACGLGTFGKNNLLITKKGCAGRFGTMVLAAELEPSPRPGEVHACLVEGCTYCQRKCPVEAFGEQGFDRHRCYAHLQNNDSLFPDLECVEVCGKCCTGPCACITD